MEKSTEQLMHALKETNDIHVYLKEQKKELLDISLSEYLNQLLKEKSQTIAEVIQRSGLAKSYVYDLFSGTRKNPNRDKLLALAFGLQLTLEETQTMLKYTGTAQLYARNQRDSIIVFCLNHNMNVVRCDELLDSEGEDILNQSVK